MSELKTSAREISVRLVGPGVGERVYRLSESATLADLLIQSGDSTTDRSVLVDGHSPEELLTPRAGMVVMIAPKPGNAAGAEPWRATVPALRDEALARAYFEILRARRFPGESDGAGG